MRVLRAISTFDRAGLMLGHMPNSRPALHQSVAVPGDIERERAELARALATRWPRAARDVLLIAGRVDHFNRRALALGLAPLAAAEPLAAASAMWAAIGALHLQASPTRPGAGTRAGRPRAR